MSTGDHGHVWDVAEKPCTDIGGGVCLTPLRGPEPDAPEGDDGYWFCHEVPGNDRRCHGRVLTRSTTGRATWTETGTLPGGDLTLNPSVLCTYPAGEHSHEFHGWIRDGKWVPA